MTALAENIVVSQEEAELDILHDVAIRLAEINIEPQIAVAVDTLEFLQDIEDKTADDLRRIKDQEKLVDQLSGEDYRNRLQNLFAEHLATLEPEHLKQYHADIVYQDAIAEMNLQLVPALQEAQQELLYGVVSKPTLQ